MAQEYVLQMLDVRKVHPPKKEVLKGMTLAFLPGAKIGVLGSNGSGKSSLLRIMAGVDKEHTGEVLRAKGMRFGFLTQEPSLDPALDVRGNVDLGVAPTRALLARYEELSMKLGETMPEKAYEKLMDEFTRAQEAIDATDAWNLDRQVEVAMEALRLPPGDADVTKLSGGERRRVALCRLLLEKPDVLLLDEPTNHLDAESVDWLEQHLHAFPGTVIAVTHDRYFLDNVAGWILELDRGEGHPFRGNYTSWLEQKQARLALEEKQESARRRTLARELEWVRLSPRARQAKSKARLAAYEAMAADSGNEKSAQAELQIPPGPRLGDLVIEVRDLRKGFGDRVLVEGLSFDLPRNGIVGIIGPNGTGKTTLFKMLAGVEKPDAGTVRFGESTLISYVDQSRDALGADNNVWQEISEGKDTIDIGKRAIPSRAYVSGFGFKGSDQQKRVGDLSGGERNRVHLAKLLKKGGNVLLLDEPTNDLDVDTLRALEDALTDFAGCVLVISHDRWFLDRIATHMLAFEGDSRVVFFEGNYQDYEADRVKRLGAEAARPTRVKFKRLA
ncbi:MAG: energy-dependent translational throttle protein EttA [Deltaproteobacteria bacterium]|nr:energy-dependent translational throttle protein EttA [Myxococcales bacterium]MDP3219435.1 energy-dependent translational throttle protein EttA [Deltaproteobacteria bacterium]